MLDCLFSGAEGSTLLGAIAGVGALFLVFLLYINKRWWLNTVGGINCCEEACPTISNRHVPSPSVPSALSPSSKPKISKAYSFDGGESSSESEMGCPKEEQNLPTVATVQYYPSPKQDLISLVEKGRVGVSSNSSCCSSTTSSVGEKHGVPASKVTPQMSTNEKSLYRPQTTSLRETRIDNQEMQYQNVETVTTVEHVDINSNRDCIVVMTTESENSELVSCIGSEVEANNHHSTMLSNNKCGHLEVALLYDAPMRKMTVHVLQARDIPSRDRGQPTHTQVGFVAYCLYTLSGCAGELMSLARSDSTGSTHSMQHGGVPELLLGLSYNATTGRLSIEVVKGSHFRNLALNRAPDTYVKLNLVSSTGQELAHSKTTVRRGQPNPLFKETFVFQVALFQLADVTLMVSVYNRKGVTKKKEMVGWFSLGLNSSGAEELAHWMDMKEFQQEQICRWHVLVQS
ncbi:synaptotagmin 14 isoform d [Holotrichia oblita]|uniref:Synaptotagmin 14 isoform d n=1 Tax=Holotrichia oblita TaxID=644536 RepID=A0ACB9TNK5_HOLOL|nr:synaptotagmin 14 isoform d [Holotrichia oblita]